MTDVTITQAFLESTQYNFDEILEDEKLFGRHFYAAGGADEVLHMLRAAEPMKPARVLDVGAGLGGAAFLMARRYDALVDGIDISWPMHHLSKERLAETGLGDRVRFFHGDVLSFSPGLRYDLVFSCNVFLHIQDKDRLLAHLSSLLTEGGTLLFGDYCVGEDGPEMRPYAAKYRYDILGMNAWQRLLIAHGFEQLSAKDCTPRFTDHCEKALRHPAISAEWLGVLTARLERIRLGQHRWCVFCYRRPCLR